MYRLLPISSSLLVLLQKYIYIHQVFGYNIINPILERLEPHFQTSARRSASKEGTETASASAHKRECTTKPTTVLPFYRSMGNFVATVEQSYGMSCRKKSEGRGGSSFAFVMRFGNVFRTNVGALQHR